MLQIQGIIQQKQSAPVPDPLPAPSNFQAFQDFPTNNVYATWDQVPGATDYIVGIAIDLGLESEEFSSTNSSGPPHTDFLTPEYSEGVSVAIRVRAWKDGDVGPWTDTIFIVFEHNV